MPGATVRNRFAIIVRQASQNRLDGEQILSGRDPVAGPALRMQCTLTETRPALALPSLAKPRGFWTVLFSHSSAHRARKIEGRKAL